MCAYIYFYFTVLKKMQGLSSINLWSLRQQFCELSDFSLTAASVIASKSQESDYASVAKNVSQQVADYNKSLIELLQNNTG